MKIIRWVLGRLILIIDYLTRPKKLIRIESQQQQIDAILKDHSLYEFHACPFCVKIRRYLRKNSLNIDIRDAKNNKKYRSELEKLGGKIQVPCLRIKNNNNNNNIWIYESNDIISYLNKIVKNE
jgi:glutaredoxin